MIMNIKTPDLTDIPALQNLWQEAFGDTKDFIDTFFQTAFDSSRCFCATDEGVIAATLYWFDCEYQNRPVAYLYAIATAKAYQGQGICHSLMVHTLDHLCKAGYVGVVLVPGNPALFDFYKDMGYDTCCFVKEFHCDSSMFSPSRSADLCAANMSPGFQPIAEAEPSPLRTLTKTEYAALRRQFLPKNSIIQENICLDFLQTQAQLYAGDGFIMAAYIENNKLFVPELLGNRTLTPQIVHALNCTEGHFRTPGTEKPFAMYLPLLENDLPLPAYFGLAFD